MKRKILIILISLLVIAGIGGGTYYYFNKQDKNSLTILEKQWIEDNKNSMIDLSIPNNIPLFSYEGTGIIYDFLTQIEKDIELDFNKIPYLDSEPNSEYAIKLVDEPSKNSIVLYQDTYALVTRNGIKYADVSEMKDMKIGVLKDQMDTVSYYLNPDELSFTSYDSFSDLTTDFLGENSKLDGIVIPKTICMDTILENDLTISYNISEMTKSLVIELGNVKRLNSILKKYYKKWETEYYQESYNKYFSDSFYNLKNIDDDTKVNFKSKRYKYGFVANAPYDQLIDHRLVGVNSLIIQQFVKLTGIEVSYDEYKSNADLMKSFNENKLDFFFNTSSTSKFDMDTSKTVSITNEQVVILEPVTSDFIVNNLSSLKNETVLTIHNTQINDYLEKREITTKKYNNIKLLLNDLKENSIIAMDLDSYNIYKNDYLKDYKIVNIFQLNSDYTYVSRDIKDNKLFNSYFNFYLQFVNEKDFFNQVNYKTFEEAEKLAFLKPLVYSIFAIVGLVIITLVIHKIKSKKKDNTGISKESKMKYIDMLTSLKNRNYLNDNIEKWDDAEIYPQTIIIVDLNNIAYINDNYGHNEGDNIIKDAANILIKTQLANTEIIRTNGNEFLIYLVEYDEKQIVSYIRKLNKEFKELEHGFGAAIGYSMINDGLKTVDDAINEATLDMRANKEEAHE